MTAGGRVLGVTALGADACAARYGGVCGGGERIHFEHARSTAAISAHGQLPKAELRGKLNSMVHRIYVEKRAAFAQEAAARKLADVRNVLGISGVLPNLRILNRYDVEGVDDALFSVLPPFTVFAEPQAGRNL